MASNHLPAVRMVLLLTMSLAACGPVSSIDRAEALDGGGQSQSGGSGGGAGGSGGQSQSGGRGGAGGAGGAVSAGGAGGQSSPDMDEEDPDVLPIDEPVEPPADTGPRKAVLVVGDPGAPLLGDVRLKAMLEARGFVVSYADDGASSGSAGSAALVVLSSSSAAATLAARYKDLAVPVLVMESHVFDDMKMTGPTKATDYDEEDDTRITILTGQDSHQLAAYYSGTVTVTSGGPAGCCGINWGKPASSATSIASYGGTQSSSRVSIFAYDAGAVMIDGFRAPARRLGFFSAETAVQQLNVDGLKLLNAALAWLVP